MAASDAPVVETLRAGDAEAVVALAREAGWNQTLADIRMVIDHGRAFGVRDDGALVASGVALPYPPDFGWIGMVLTTSSRRRRGLATALMARCVETLETDGLVPMLDATPAGEQVYARLGFAGSERIERWRGVAAPGPPPAGVRPVRPDDLDALVAGDARAFGAERRAILGDMLRREAAPGFVAEDGEGFVLWRRGRTATQIGPLVAGSGDAALALLRAALGAVAGAVLLDAPARATRIGGELAALGFEIERPFLRMAKGRAAAFGRFDRITLCAGPELG